MGGWGVAWERAEYPAAASGTTIPSRAVRETTSGARDPVSGAVLLLPFSAEKKNPKDTKRLAISREGGAGREAGRGEGLVLVEADKTCGMILPRSCRFSARIAPLSHPSPFVQCRSRKKLPRSRAGDVSRPFSFSQGKTQNHVVCRHKYVVTLVGTKQSRRRSRA